MKEHIGLANAAKVSTKEVAGGLVEDVFAETLKMSTYLVAIGVLAGYDARSVHTANTSAPISLSVFAPDDQMESTGTALWAAEEGLAFLEAFFRQPFPLPKQDLVALADFAAGAMENWGLITFRSVAAAVIASLTLGRGLKGQRPAHLGDDDARQVQGVRGRRRHPRTGPPVVRQPRNHEMVHPALSPSVCLPAM